jgi:hypothetical protein
MSPEGTAERAFELRRDLKRNDAMVRSASAIPMCIGRICEWIAFDTSM